jgi:hypothetical protein
MQLISFRLSLLLVFLGVSYEGDFEYDPNVTITNQLLVKSDFDNYQRSAATGTVTWTQSCTWLSSVARRPPSFLGSRRPRQMTPRFLRPVSQLQTLGVSSVAYKLVTTTVLPLSLMAQCY